MTFDNVDDRLLLADVVVVAIVGIVLESVAATADVVVVDDEFSLIKWSTIWWFDPRIVLGVVNPNGNEPIIGNNGLEEAAAAAAAAAAATAAKFDAKNFWWGWWWWLWRFVCCVLVWNDRPLNWWWWCKRFVDVDAGGIKWDGDDDDDEETGRTGGWA